MKILRTGLLLFFALLSLGQFQRFQLSSQIALYLHELVLVLLVVFSFPKLLKGYFIFFQGLRKKRIVIIFALYLVVHTIITQILHPNLVPLLYLLRVLLYVQLFFLSQLAISLDESFRKTLEYFVWGLGWTLSVLGLIQYAVWPDTRSLFALGWDDHYFRLISTLFDPNFTGLIIGISILIYILDFFALHRFTTRFFAVFPMLCALLLTYSRASYLAFVATIGLLSLRTRKIRLLLFILAVFLPIVFLPRPTGEGVRLERTSSISSRITSNIQALSSLSFAEVAFGTGFFTQITPSTNGLPNHAVSPDNSFVFLFVSLGIFGSLLLIKSMYEYKEHLLIEPMRSVLLIISIHSLFNNSLFYIWTMAVLWIMLAVGSRKRITV